MFALGVLIGFVIGGVALAVAVCIFVENEEKRIIASGKSNLHKISLLYVLKGETIMTGGLKND